MRRPFEPDPGHAGEGTGMLQDQPIRDIAAARISSRAQISLRADVIGAGIAGTWQALALREGGPRRHRLRARRRRDDAGDQPRRRRHAGAVVRGRERRNRSSRGSAPRSLELWREELPDTPFNGSLVVAHPRDRADFDRFAQLTTGHQRLDAAGHRRSSNPRSKAGSATRCSFRTKAMSSRAACCRSCTRGWPRRRADPLRNRARTAATTTALVDRLPRPCARATPAPTCAASRAR